MEESETETINTISFRSGTTTCAWKPGEFCSFLRTRSFGTKYYCQLFETYIKDDESGWLQRSQACLDSQKPNLQVD